ncbi:MAG: glycosyltransferase family 4 protein [Candidatus Sumerlaeia bacterium]|nr:glycosyltransferase family 4 protein [Candidatus Sumerlaeia bacterium]
MKILHTNFLRGWGGQSNRILHVCKGLAARGHEVCIAAPAESELVRRAREARLAVETSMTFRRGWTPLPFLRDVAAMRRLLARSRFDVIHTHGSLDSWVVALAHRPRRIPIVRTKHNIFPIADHFANRWIWGQVFDRIVCISQAIFDYCAAKPYIRRERLVLIHSAIDLERYSRPVPERVAEWRARWSDHSPVVVIVGRLREEKGHTVLFEALGYLRQKYPKILLAVAGDGSLRKTLERQAAETGLGACVCFLGFRTDVPEILAAADLFVMPSLAEGLGTAAIEASAAGKPIVASRVGGICDVVRDGETGRLVPPGDAVALAQAMDAMLSDRAAAERMGQAARQFAFATFTLDALVKRNIALYREILAGL